MTHKNNFIGFLGIIALMMMLTTSSAWSKGISYKIDRDHSQIIFKIKHLNISMFYGVFTEVTGTFVLDEKKVSKSNISVEIPLRSLFTANRKRDKHLRGPDFFSAREFPKITFKSTKVTKSDEDHYRIDGYLTLRGIRNPISLSATKIGEGKDPWGGHRVGLEGHVTIKRSDYGMKYQIPGLSDEVTLILAIEGIQS